MPGLEISDARGRAEAGRLTAGRTALQVRSAVPDGDLAGVGVLVAALRASVTVSAALLDVAVEATTLGALAITNAVLDAADADR